jgi:phage/conjugal plasmid C-4 type zinc finger TraR family protein
MDFADIAQREEERDRERALARIKQQSGESRADCAQCGDDIPELRRATLPGVSLCVGCQTEIEKRRRRL